MTDIVARIQAQNYLANSRSQSFAGLQQRVLISMILPAVALAASLRCVAQNYDGPAELPRVTVPSAMSDTPAPGAVIKVNATDLPMIPMDSEVFAAFYERSARSLWTAAPARPARWASPTSAAR